MTQIIQEPIEQKEYTWEDFLKLRGSSKKKTSWKEYREMREQVSQEIMNESGL